VSESASSRLEQLLFARRVLVQQAEAGLAQIDRWIAQERRREEERRLGEQRRPPPPEWLLQYGLNRRNVDYVHRGDCWAAAKSGRCRPVTREQALEALRHQVSACTYCRPDTELGVLE
jgi:Tfp pilus assembly protein PilX